jgi:hypothetical protein
MICFTCLKAITNGEVYYTATAQCALPESIPDKHKAYSQGLLVNRLKDYRPFHICLGCSKATKKEFVKPKPVKRFLGKNEDITACTIATAAKV